MHRLCFVIKDKSFLIPQGVRLARAHSLARKSLIDALVQDFEGESFPQGGHVACREPQLHVLTGTVRVEAREHLFRGIFCQVFIERGLF